MKKLNYEKVRETLVDIYEIIQTVTSTMKERVVPDFTKTLTERGNIEKSRHEADAIIRIEAYSVAIVEKIIKIDQLLAPKHDEYRCTRTGLTREEIDEHIFKMVQNGTYDAYADKIKKLRVNGEYIVHV